MSWVEIKSALNSTVGKGMKPIDKMNEKEAYDIYYYTAPFLARVSLMYGHKGEQGTEKVLEVPYGLKTTYGIMSSGNGYTLGYVFLPSTLDEVSEGFIPTNGGGTSLVDLRIPPFVKSLKAEAFEGCSKLTNLRIPKLVDDIGEYAFGGCISLYVVCFEGTPSSIDSSAFANCNALYDIYVPWSEGEVANAPWGATNATIHYDHIL